MCRLPLALDFMPSREYKQAKEKAVAAFLSPSQTNHRQVDSSAILKAQLSELWNYNKVFLGNCRPEMYIPATSFENVDSLA